MVEETELERVLTAQYFLADLNAAQRERLLGRARRRTLAAGAHLFQQGDEAHFFYVVLQGRLKLYRLSVGGDERIMGLALPGQSFAEGVLFMDAPKYPVNAQALESSAVVGLDRDTFLGILAESFPTCLAVMARMTRRIQGLLDEIESLTLQNGRERLIHFLLGLVPDKTRGAASIRLPARKSEIAARLSIQPETLSRLFRWLDEEGLIRSHRDCIEIPDLEALRAAVRA